MKIKTYYLFLVVATGFFCAAVPGQVELSPHVEEPLLISQPHPALAGIDKLHVAVLRYGTRPAKDVSFWKQLEKNVNQKLRQAGIKLETPTADNILTISELRIHVSTLSLEDSQQFVLHIRTALARAVCLKDQTNPVFKADIWQTTPAMQAVSAEKIPAKVNDIVLEQIDSFINIYKATNPAGKQLLDVNIDETGSLTAPDKQVENDTNSTTTEKKYVASNSSSIFHKPDCRWAKNISDQNLVSYKSKDEAIKAGKRPCKTCNP